MCFICSDRSSYLDLGAENTSEGVDGIDGDVYIYIYPICCHVWNIYLNVP